VDGAVILAPGGDDALVMAVNCETGEVLWTSPNPHGWEMSHASIVPMTVEGTDTYVYCALGGVAGVSAKNGELLWDTNEWRIMVATVPTPVLVGDNRIFLSGGYNAGSMMIRIEKEGGEFSVKTLFELGPGTFGSDQQTPIFYEGYIYGVVPGGMLVCLDLEGNAVWSSGSSHTFGLGPYTIADGKIYIMNDTGLLTIAEATPDGYHQLDQADVFDGHDSWGPLTITGGRLIARDLKTMKCFDIRKR
jgi:outer membrane protein assembly factor BamB